MSIVITRIDQSQDLNALNTYNYTVPAAGMYLVNISITEQPPSGVTISLKQNSSVKASTSAPAATQGVINLQVVMNCAQNDVIGVILASSVASDTKINSLRGSLKITQGSF